MPKRENMRHLLLAGGFLIYLSNAAAAQQDPIRFGLWEGTIVQRSTVTPYTASILRQKGQTVPVSFSQSYRVCMDQAKWEKAKAVVSIPPQGCLILHKENTSNRLDYSVKCKLEDGTSILIGADIAWESGTRAKAMNTLDTVYPGTMGKVSVETKIDSHFVASGCGHLAPGASEPLH
jgi:Protein of unknown function (DUF3617)